MTGRGLFIAGSAVLLLALSLALSGVIYRFFGFLLLIALLYGLISSILAYRTLMMSFSIPSDHLLRGEELPVTLYAFYRSLLPVAEPEFTLSFAQQSASSHVSRGEAILIPFRAGHVGCFEVKLESIRISDMFGLFSWSKRNVQAQTVLVYPRPFPIDKPEYCTGDEGSAALNRTQEDYTSPEDVRPFRPGDPMKRVHWKLYRPTRELVVRKFETPAPPDTLIILDCAEIESTESEDKAASIRDTLCETAVAVAKLQMEDLSPVRLPLYGQRANEFVSDKQNNLPLLQEMLARQTFRKGEDFANVLTMELKRMRRTGAAIIITTRLDAAVADAVISIRRMGPSARLYLVTMTPGDEKYQSMIARLQHHLVEVCYVTPS